MIEWRPRILSSRMQTSHMCQLTCPWSPSLGKGISCSFLHRFEWLLLHKMRQMKGYKMFLGSKTNREMWVQTWTTLACFKIIFMTFVGEIFFKYFWNIIENFFKKILSIVFIKKSYDFIELYAKSLGKNVIFKKFQLHLLFKSKCYNV